MVKIKKETVESILSAAKSTYPNEFLALLGVDEEGVISELVVLPAVYGKRHSFLYNYSIPFDSSIAGSIHSHPSPNFRPSKADLRLFSRMGKVHFIAAYPFTPESLKCYNSEGKEIEFEVVE